MTDALPDPPRPDQLPAGIPIDEPAPPETADPFEALVPHDQAANPFESLVPEKNRRAASSANPFESLVPKSSGGLDKDRPIEHLPGTDFAGSVLHGMNKANPIPYMVKGENWLMNKGLHAVGVDTDDALAKSNAQVDRALTPNPEATTANKMGDAAGNMLMSVPETGAALSAVPGVSTLSGMKYVPWAGRAGDAIGDYAAQGLKNAAIAVPRAGQAALKGVVADPTDIAPQLGKRASTIMGMQNAPQSVGKAVSNYVVSNAGAGAGQEGMREATKDAPGYVSAPAEMAGAVLGGGLPNSPALAARYWKYGIYPNMIKMPFNIAKGSAINYIPESAIQGSGAVPSILRNMRSKYTDMMNEKAMPAAAKMYNQMMTPEAGQSMGVAQDLRQKMPGFNPTMAEATGIPSLTATQKGVEQQSSGNLLDKMVARKKASEAAVQGFADKNAPAASDTDIAPAVQRRVDQAAQPVADAQANMQTAREGAAEALPTAKPYDQGNYLRDRQEALRTEKQDEMSQLAEDSGLVDAKKLPVSGPSLQGAVTGALPQTASPTTKALALKASPTMRAIDGLKEGEPLSFEDAKFYMENLGQEARQAAKAGDMKTAAMIGNTRDGIDRYLSNEWSPALGLGDKYKAFRQTYKNEYIDRFGAGTAQDVGAVGGDQRYRTDNEDVAGSYFAPGDTTAAKDFHRTFAGDSMAGEAMQGHILDQVRKAAVKDGVVDQKALSKWIDANPQLSEFPSTQKMVQDLHSLNQGLVDRQATLATRQSAVEDSHLSGMLKDNDVSVDRLLQDKPSFQRVMKGATDEEKSSMARQMWDRANQGGQTDPAGMKQFLTDHADVLPTVLGKDHIDALHDIQHAWEMNARAPTPVGQPVNPGTAGFNVKSLTGSSPQTLLSRAFAVQSGRTGVKYTIGDLVARAGLNLNNQQAQQMMDRAMYDKDFAQQLADYVNAPKITTVKQKAMKSYLFNAGIDTGVDEEEDKTPHITLTHPHSYTGQAHAQGGIISRFSTGGGQ